MILEYLTEDITLESLMKKVEGLEIGVPQKKDYDPGLWPDMKNKRFISTYEKFKGRDGLWQITFKSSRLFFVQYNIEFGVKSESAYNNCVEICRMIAKINNTVRKMHDQFVSTELKTYTEFSNEVLTDSGLPGDRYIEFAGYSWRNKVKSSYLSATHNWPDTMSIEYREDQI